MSNKYSYVKYYHSDRDITTVEQLLSSDLFFNNSISKKDFLKFQATNKDRVEVLEEERKTSDNGVDKKRYTTTANLPKWKIDFIKRVGNVAVVEMKRHNILASVTTAQAILESGWGESELAKEANNLFGIKGSYLGQSYNISTGEYLNGKDEKINADFRKYPTQLTSIRDHSDFLRTKFIYRKVIGEKDYGLACIELQRAGYATAPNYAETLMDIIEDYNLTYFDEQEVDSESEYDNFSLIEDEGFEFDKEDYPKNIDLIWSKYSFEEKYNNRNKYASNDLSLLKQGTVLFIPLTSFNKELLPIRGKNFLDQSKEMIPFFSQKQLELESDESYVKAEELLKEGRESSVQIIEENCQVWVYSKTLEKIVDISPFIQSLSITKGDVGSFSMNLVPISAVLDRASNSEEFDLISVFGTDYINEYTMFQEGQLNISFFDKYFQQNDVVFIRFERLELEKDNVIRSGLEIDKQCLPDQVFDMMGLIDVVGSSINTQMTDYSISISGRDFTKVLIEDGQYLMGLLYVQGNQNRFYYGGNPGDKFYKRNYVNDGAFEFMFAKMDRKGIADSLAFIVNQMSNIGWTDNELFSAYGSKRTSAYRMSNVENYEDYISEQEVNGIWQITKLNVDEQLKDRRIANDSMFDVDGNLIEFFKNICQDPFVEFWGDTYGSQFEFIVRQPPLDSKGLREIISKEHYITVKAKDTLQINLNWEDEYYSWFQFTPDGANYDKSEMFYGFHFPIIYLEKYIENFGNHRMVINDKYVPESSYSGENQKQDENTTARALFNDLRFALEYYSVLPFTRKGTIVINGDRRIRKGGFIYLEATNELCYVDGVTNNISFNSNNIDRTTVLSVKRCMMKDYIKGSSTGEASGSLTENKMSKEEIIFIALQKAKGVRMIGEISAINKTFSYFDIVKSEVITDDLYNRIAAKEGSPLESENIVKPNSNTKTDFTVDEEAFSFFLKRKQMD